MRIRPKYVCVVHATATGVADRFRSRYEMDGKWLTTAFGSAEIIYERLCELGPVPDIEDAAKIIGNQSWSYLTCSGCREYITKGVAFQESYDDNKPILCETCLREAVTVLGEE